MSENGRLAALKSHPTRQLTYSKLFASRLEIDQFIKPTNYKSPHPPSNDSLGPPLHSPLRVQLSVLKHPIPPELPSSRPHPRSTRPLATTQARQTRLLAMACSYENMEPNLEPMRVVRLKLAPPMDKEVEPRHDGDGTEALHIMSASVDAAWPVCWRVSGAHLPSTQPVPSARLSAQYTRVPCAGKSGLTAFAGHALVRCCRREPGQLRRPAARSTPESPWASAARTECETGRAQRGAGAEPPPRGLRSCSR